MESFPKISVIVPVYNVEKCLRKCLDSILANTFNDFELLLIDDGSQDTSGVICDEYSACDSRVHVIHQDNAGPSAARNRGLDNAHGDWITFVDSDDWIEPNYLQSFVDNQKQYNADIVVVGYYDVSLIEKYNLARVKKNILPDRTYRCKDIYKFHISLGCNIAFSVLWNKMFSSVIIKKYHLSFDETLPRSEDWIFVVSFLRYANLLVTSSAMTYYYIRRDTKGQSLAQIPLPIVYRISENIYEMGLELSHERDYVQHLKNEYAWQLFTVVIVMYNKHCNLTICERINILKKLRSIANNKRIENQYYKYFKDFGVPFRSVYFIEILFKLKNYVNVLLPRWILKKRQMKKAKNMGAEYIKIQDLDRLK